ncbi:CLUMA_CG000330, isoform A [Clunio marinus]|uniref:CLUMA_CG000330, isoform A n=1 Tax=Clunio marinus TaxID=568069 RepID=A0A1J1HK10_9DIPT|nr:CLUMA_CG000330, isoform A [Clunio marinus]
MHRLMLNATTSGRKYSKLCTFETTQSKRGCYIKKHVYMLSRYLVFRTKTCGAIHQLYFHLL